MYFLLAASILTSCSVELGNSIQTKTFMANENRQGYSEQLLIKTIAKHFPDVNVGDKRALAEVVATKKGQLVLRDAAVKEMKKKIESQQHRNNLDEPLHDQIQPRRRREELTDPKQLMLDKGPSPWITFMRSMSASSSSDEEYEHLKEAIDPSYLSDDLFNTKTSKKEIIKPLELPPSLRKKNEPVSTFNPLEIRVTPEFRTHVSKHLRKILDELIDDTQELPINVTDKNNKNKDGSIKLLRNSTNFISDEQEQPVSSERKFIKIKRRTTSNSSSDDEEKKAKEVAVTAEWILSGKATEGWAPSTKGEVEVICVPVTKN